MHDVLKIEMVFPILAFDPAKLIYAGKGFSLGGEQQMFLIFKMSFWFGIPAPFLSWPRDVGAVTPLGSQT